MPTSKGGDSNVPFQIAIHNGEEHLQKQVDGVDQHRQQVEPRFAGHVGQTREIMFGECLRSSREKEKREKRTKVVIAALSGSEGKIGYFRRSKLEGKTPGSRRREDILEKWKVEAGEGDWIGLDFGLGVGGESVWSSQYTLVSYGKKTYGQLPIDHSMYMYIHPYSTEYVDTVRTLRSSRYRKEPLPIRLVLIIKSIHRGRMRYRCGMPQSTISFTTYQKRSLSSQHSKGACLPATYIEQTILKV